VIQKFYLSYLLLQRHILYASPMYIESGLGVDFKK
jgi:hypothetical protein